jgi:hypothetical protein
MALLMSRRLAPFHFEPCSVGFIKLRVEGWGSLRSRQNLYPSNLKYFTIIISSIAFNLNSSTSDL